jgi:acyl-coenzyme A synthetase/AMP-(fatty) acid ligase
VAATWRRTEAVTLGNISIYIGRGRAVWVPLTGADSLMGYAMGVCAWRLGAAAGAGVPVEGLHEMMERFDTGIAVVTPTLLRLMLQGLPSGFLTRPGWRLQAGGSVLPPSLAEAVALRISPDIWVGYGATESSCLATGPALALADAPGAVGSVVAGAEVEIIDEAGRPLTDGESGELRVRGMRTAEGYVGDPEATAAVFRDGWYHTRDLARRLADGRVVIEGRIDERMNLGGRKLMPITIEAPAQAHPGVVDCAAFSVPDAGGMEQAWLAVVTEAGVDRARLGGEIASTTDQPPLRFAWIDEIPRNAMGKVERGHLRDAVLSALAGRQTTPSPEA